MIAYSRVFCRGSACVPAVKRHFPHARPRLKPQAQYNQAWRTRLSFLPFFRGLQLPLLAEPGALGVAKITVTLRTNEYRFSVTLSLPKGLPVC